ncbi:MAG: aldose 1-epimerase family protein [Candidatus Sumerlaeia bacterium]
MAFLWGRHWTRAQLMQRVGDAGQLGGARRVVIAEGPGKGVECVEFDTGAGLSFSVAVDRCLDIPRASFRGASLCWHSMTGLEHPAFVEAIGRRFLYHFFGGLLTTCGLTAMGAPAADQFGEAPMHGRATGLPAEGVCVWNRWTGDEMDMGVSGTVRETALFGPHLRLTRTITARLGQNAIRLCDVVENAGFEPTPFQILYHINYGFPLLDAATGLIIADTRVEPMDETAAAGLNDWARFDEPRHGWREQCFLHQVTPDAEGWAALTLRNPAIFEGEGLAVRQRWSAGTLPFLTEWKMIGEGAYVVGLEPGNAYPLGRDREHAAGRLQILEPGQRVELRVEWEII